MDFPELVYLCGILVEQKLNHQEPRLHATLDAAWCEDESCAVDEYKMIPVTAETGVPCLRKDVN